MMPLELKGPQPPNVPVVLLTGASGYIGGRLIPMLEKQPVALRCLVRNPDNFRLSVNKSTQIVRGDVLDLNSLDEALQGVCTAYYLVHLMSGPKDFEKADRVAATNFAQAAKERVSVESFTWVVWVTTPNQSSHRICAADMKLEKY